MPGVFISYRRDDSQGFAGRLSDDLDELLGDDRVFRDVEIPIGSDFTDVLHRAIAASDALLVVIGRHWTAQSVHGFESRLFEPTDWVRTEIEAAFAQAKQVIPVLVGGAHMPAANDLPDSIRHLAHLQAAELSDRHWDDEIGELADRLRTLCPSLASDRPAFDRAESPAEVLRQLGERLLDEVASRRRPRVEPAYSQRLLGSIGRSLRKLAGMALVLALIYFGIRLFGDQSMLNALDAFEARLQIGWERLQYYLQRVQTAGAISSLALSFRA
jgi:hypothetical protein